MTGLAHVDCDDRGVSSSVTHALALGITAILISGLLFTAGTLLEDQRQDSAREQLRTVGNRIADDLSRASALAQDGGNVTFQTRHPTSVAGRPYSVRLLTGAGCDTDLFDSEACLELVLQDGRTSVMVPLRNETAVTFDRTGKGRYAIAAVKNATAPALTYPSAHTDLRVGIGESIDQFSPGTAVNASNKNPISGFTFSPGQPSNQTVVHFENDTKDLDGVIASYEWDFDGDGVAERTGPEVDHNFARPGKYTVTLTVTDDDGATDSVSKVVSVGGLAFDDASAENVSGSMEDGAIHFNVTNLHRAPIEINSLLIDPVSGTPDRLDASGGGKPEIVIAGDNRVGEYDGGEIIYPGGRIFDISSDHANLSAKDEADVELNGFRNSSSGTVLDMVSEPVDVTMRYEVEGQYYTSRFRLDPAAGGDSSDDPPIPRFSVDCDDAPKCDFADASSDPDDTIVDRHWSFGDGETSGDLNPAHDFGANGTYAVSLTVTNDASPAESSTLTRTVTVGTARPVLVFAVNAGGPEMEIDGTRYEADNFGDPHQFLFTDGGERFDSVDDSDPIYNVSGAEENLYRSARLAEDGWFIFDPGSFGYEVPVPNGEYAVTFKFAELDTTVGSGDRRINVEMEGNDVLTEYDVYDAAGGNHQFAVYRTEPVPVDDGNLMIEFKPDSNVEAPTLSALVVRQEWADSFQGSAGKVAMEAEKHMRVVPGANPYDTVHWNAFTDGSANGSKALRAGSGEWVNTGDTEEGERLDYYVDFDEIGTYNVWVRMRCPDNSSRSVHVGLDGVPVTFGGNGMNGNGSELCTPGSGWMWASQAAGSPVTVDVDSTGPHTLNVWMRQDGVEIDKIVLAKEANYPSYHPTDDGQTGPDDSTIAPP